MNYDPFKVPPKSHDTGPEGPELFHKMMIVIRQSVNNRFAPRIQHKQDCSQVINTCKIMQRGENVPIKDQVLNRRCSFLFIQLITV